MHLFRGHNLAHSRQGKSFCPLFLETHSPQAANLWPLVILSSLLLPPGHWVSYLQLAPGHCLPLHSSPTFLLILASLSVRGPLDPPLSHLCVICPPTGLFISVPSLVSDVLLYTFLANFLDSSALSSVAHVWRPLTLHELSCPPPQYSFRRIKEIGDDELIRASPSSGSYVLALSSMSTMFLSFDAFSTELIFDCCTTHTHT